MEFRFSSTIGESLDRILALKDPCEILFALKHLGVHSRNVVVAYRRYAYELLRHHPDFEKTIDVDRFREIDSKAKQIFQGTGGGGYIEGCEWGEKRRSMGISWSA